MCARTSSTVSTNAGGTLGAWEDERWRLEVVCGRKDAWKWHYIEYVLQEDNPRQGWGLRLGGTFIEGHGLSP